MALTMSSKLVIVAGLASACAGPEKPTSAAAKMTAQDPSPAGRAANRGEPVGASDAAPGSVSSVTPVDNYDPNVSTGNETQQPFSWEQPIAQYWRDLAEQVSQAWVSPVERMTEDVVGCFHVLPEGKIVEIMLKRLSGDHSVDESVRLALTSIQKERDQHPIPVPADQLLMAKRWICIKFAAGDGKRKMKLAR